ncbi:MAG: beta-ketoacyl-ACP synthase II [Dehalococcoidia bacterium]
MISASNRVVITGAGAVTPVGLTAQDFYRGLIEGKSGIGPISAFDASSFQVKAAAEVKGFDPARYMPVKRVDRTGRCTQFAIASTRMALESASLDVPVVRPDRVGVIVASSGMMSAVVEEGEKLNRRGPKRIDPLFISKIAPSMVPAQVALEIGAKGPNSVVNSACASGTDAIAKAFNHIRLGHADVMLAGGAEAPVSPIGIASMSIVGALSRNPDPEKACRPFDLKRDGFVLGEGAGILVLERYEHALERGATILAELGGAGWSFDAFSETAPEPETEAVAMKMAIDDAGIRPEDIDYINAHGTGTQFNDAAETAATKIVFAKRAYEIPISANKSMTGHSACAAGAIEAVAAVLTVVNGVIPPTINYSNPDPDCDLDYVPNQAREQRVRACLSNSFGMGGQNCCLVIRSADNLD